MANESSSPSTPERNLLEELGDLLACLQCFPGVADKDKFQRWWDWREKILKQWTIDDDPKQEQKI